MNIIVKPYGSDLCYCRPDTTWERENRDFYSPECVNEIYCTPVIFARVCKAGKCVGAKFVERYYDGIGCGILLYGASENGIISYIDKSSILPMPLYNPVVLEDDEKVFDVQISNNKCTHQLNTMLNGAKKALEDAICSSSELISLRIGDYVAVEMNAPFVISAKTDEEVSLKGTFCNNEVFDFKIIM